MTHHASGKLDSKEKDLEDLLRTLIIHQINEEQYFCSVLSILGEEETKLSFMKLVGKLELTHPKQHKNLMMLYVTNFSEQTVKNIPIPQNDYDDVLQIEFALKLSLETEVPEDNDSKENSTAQERYKEEPSYRSVMDPSSLVTTSTTRQQQLRKSKCQSGLGQRKTWSSVVGGQLRQTQFDGCSQFKYVPTTECGEDSSSSTPKPISQKPTESEITNSAQSFFVSKSNLRRGYQTVSRKKKGKREIKLKDPCYRDLSYSGSDEI